MKIIMKMNEMLEAGNFQLKTKTERKCEDKNIYELRIIKKSITMIECQLIRRKKILGESEPPESGDELPIFFFNLGLNK